MVGPDSEFGTDCIIIRDSLRSNTTNCFKKFKLLSSVPTQYELRRFCGPFFGTINQSKTRMCNIQERIRGNNVFRCTVVAIIQALYMSLKSFAAGNEMMNGCFDHEECAANKFCGWSNCLDETGRRFSCGKCKPCSECTCNSDSTDFECPRARCPASPVNGVFFFQGEFFNFTDIQQILGYRCIRRLTISSRIFSFFQLPVYVLHPANTATLDETELLTRACPSYLHSGVISRFVSVDGNFLDLTIIISSEGTNASKGFVAKLSLQLQETGGRSGRSHRTARMVYSSAHRMERCSSTLRPNPTTAGTEDSSSSKALRQRRIIHPPSEPRRCRRGCTKERCPTAQRPAACS